MQLISADQNLTTDNDRHSFSFYLFLALTFILLGRPQDIFPILKPFSLVLTLAVITLIATLMDKEIYSNKKLFEIKEVKKYILFFCVMIVGIPFADHSGMAFDYIFLLYSSNMLFFYLLILHVDKYKKLKSIIFTLCVSVFFYSIFTLIKGSHFGGRFAFGSMYDPNDIAYLFVSLFPLNIFFLINDDKKVKKITCLITITSLLIVILLSGSRGGLLGLIATLFLLFFTKLGNLKRSYKIVSITMLAISFLLFSKNINTERYFSLASIGDDYNVKSETGRLAIWKRGLKLTLSQPITGVGVNCFGRAIGYDREAEGEIPKWQVAHNSYIQVLTETGIIGFTIFVSICIGCLKTFFYCSKRIDDSVPEAEGIRKLSGLLLIGFIGSLVCAFFLTQAYSIIFSSYFALSAVINKLYNNLEAYS